MSRDFIAEHYEALWQSTETACSSASVHVHHLLNSQALSAAEATPFANALNTSRCDTSDENVCRHCGVRTVNASKMPVTVGVKNTVHEVRRTVERRQLQRRRRLRGGIHHCNGLQLRTAGRLEARIYIVAH